MRPVLSILPLIALLTFFLSSCVSRAAQDAESLPEISESYMHDDWTELLSFLYATNIADKIQEAPFVTNILGIPMTSADKDRPDARASSDSIPERRTRSLEALLSKELGNIIRPFETVINSTVALGTAFNDVLESLSSDDSFPPHDAPFGPLLKTVATLVAIARDDFRAKFPLPATAPGHAARIKRVAEALERYQRLIVRLAKKHGIEQEVIERHLARIKPLFRDAGVLVGDVVELYPSAIEAFVLNVSAILLPEAAFLRSLVILYCFGPCVLGQDAISGWLFKHV